MLNLVLWSVTYKSEGLVYGHAGMEEVHGDTT